MVFSIRIMGSSFIIKENSALRSQQIHAMNLYTTLFQVHIINHS